MSDHIQKVPPKTRLEKLSLEYLPEQQDMYEVIKLSTRIIKTEVCDNTKKTS